MKKKALGLISILVMISIILVVSVNYILAGDSTYGASGAILDNNITMEKSLIYSIQDEYLAQTKYSYVISKFGDVTPFNNIIVAEANHIDALKPLFSKYNVPIPINDSTNRIIKVSTLEEALQIGIDSEINNIAMYEKFLTFNIPQDIKTVFNSLKSASESHLAAFQKRLSNIS